MFDIEWFHYELIRRVWFDGGVDKTRRRFIWRAVLEQTVGERRRICGVDDTSIGERMKTRVEGEIRKCVWNGYIEMEYRSIERDSCFAGNVLKYSICNTEQFICVRSVCQTEVLQSVLSKHWWFQHIISELFGWIVSLNSSFHLFSICSYLSGCSWLDDRQKRFCWLHFK